MSKDPSLSLPADPTKPGSHRRVAEVTHPPSPPRLARAGRHLAAVPEDPWRLGCAPRWGWRLWEFEEAQDRDHDHGDPSFGATWGGTLTITFHGIENRIRGASSTLGTAAAKHSRKPCHY